jgi:hypothetical protein
MDSAIFDELEQTFTEDGAVAAIDRLCTRLRDQRDYDGLFYALLLKKRHELGVSPIPTGPAQELPAAVHEPYEDAIRAAGRMVGQLYLDQGDIARAWMYFRMLGEPKPVADAIDKLQPGDGEDVQQLVEIAYHQGVHPRKGFELILKRFGLCNAITTASSQELAMAADVREYCVQRLVRALHQELLERLEAEIVRKEGLAPQASGGRQPPVRTVKELIAGRDWLFEDEFYHVDVSHLSAVVHMSIHLHRGEELDMSRELCAYGRRLSPRFQYPGDPPFEDQYRDYGVYLAVLAGDDVEAGLAHFQDKVEKADPESDGTRPAEVLVNLLLRLDRPAEALAAARRYLANVDSRQLTCPSITELCQRTNDYRTLKEVAREQSDPVHFMAGLIAGKEIGNSGG